VHGQKTVSSVRFLRLFEEQNKGQLSFSPHGVGKLSTWLSWLGFKAGCVHLCWVAVWSHMASDTP